MFSAAPNTSCWTVLLQNGQIIFIFSYNEKILIQNMLIIIKRHLKMSCKIIIWIKLKLEKTLRHDFIGVNLNISGI